MSDTTTPANGPQTGTDALDGPDLRRALAFNAVGPALNERGEWLPLSVRQAVADAVLAAVDGTAPEPCVHPAGYEGECPCKPSCGCCTATASAEPESACAHCGDPGHAWEDCQAYTKAVAEDAPAPEPGLRERLARVAALADEYPVHVDTALLLEALDGQAVEDPELQQLREQVARVHAYLIRLCAEPHPSHDHVCPDDVRRDILTALDEPQEQP